MLPIVPVKMTLLLRHFSGHCVVAFTFVLWNAVEVSGGGGTIVIGDSDCQTQVDKGR